jgi:uncharacterized radical SAM protein YgiQ
VDRVASEREARRDFLPRTREQMALRGWDELDVLLVTGDAYVDHPSFGVSAIGRLLEQVGLRVGILDVPELEPDGSGWSRLPAPRLWIGVSAGTIDSMVTNYTAAKKRRRTDVYRPGGIPGRPNRATIAYTALARHHFPHVPVVVGGLEAGPRRLAHYDYWDDRIRRSILVDSKADLLVWGMGERTVLAISKRLQSGGDLHGLPNTCEILPAARLPGRARRVPSYEDLAADSGRLAEVFNAAREENAPDARPLAQAHGARWVVQWPPLEPASQAEVDGWYELPYQRAAHPDHDGAGGVPALEPVRWSINTHRGCLADCTFCSITFHQGRTIQSRSVESVLREARALARRHDFRGTITDVGGPTANMWGLGCKLLEAGKPCLNRDCLAPDVCPALRIDSQSEGYRRLLALVRSSQGVKHAFVSSGVRYDLLFGQKQSTRGQLLPLHEDLLRHHTSGRMKLAPEHASSDVLRAMNKPGFEVYEAYEKAYKEDCAALGKDQHLVNYFIVGHPGTGLAQAVELFEKLLERNYSPEQVQEFIPLPMTRACVQYVTGRDPQTAEELYVPRSARERKLQKALVRWKAPENRRLVEEALRQAGAFTLLERFRRAIAGGKHRAQPAAEAGGRPPADEPADEALDLDTCG